MKKALIIAIALVALLSTASIVAAGNNENGNSGQPLTAEQKLARWQNGQVLHNGRWQLLEDIERLVSHDPRWQEYNERVATGEDSAAAHAELARWCRSQGMELEEQWHWVNVLRHEAKNREALGALNLRPHQGTYLTAEQIAQAEAAEEQAEDNFKRYSKVLKAAMREAGRGEGAERAAGLKKISGIADPAAIDALVEVVLADAKNEKRILSKFGTENGEKLLRQIQQAAIAALAEMPEHEATLALLETALYASDSQVRTDAAQSLKYREPTSFMPLLMGGLAAPIELNVTVNTLPNGQITVFEDFSEAGPLATKKHTRSSTFHTQHVSTHTQDTTLRADRFTYGKTYRSTRIARVWSEKWRDMANAAAQVSSTQDRVATENSIRKEQNARIQEVMETASGKELGEDPEAWWADWKDYNEVYTPEELPVVESEENYDYSRVYEQYTYGRMLPKLEPRPVVRTMSCFVAGTPVWTQAGMVPIEEIRIGDLVLSQNPDSGELNYRPVVDRTVRPPSGTIELAADGETIVATRGHRFWTADNGWVMAKFLKAGQQLVSAKGLLDLQSAEAGADAQAFNLEVGQFHTYFVGKNRILVHDNTCPQPTTNKLPGVPGRGAVADQMALRN